MPTAREATTHLADLLRREHLALADFLVALSVFHREERWVELGYSSLFYFLTRELGLSKGAAYYRKTAAELVHAYPEVLAALREGKLCLSSIVELAKVLTPENRAEVLPRFFHVSKREAKEVTAELLPAPAPPLRTIVTAVRGAGDGGWNRAHAVGGEPAQGRAAGSAAGSASSAALFAAPDAAPGLTFTPGAFPPANLVHASALVPGVALAASCAGFGTGCTPGAVHPANLVRASPPVPGVASPAPADVAPDRARRAEAEPLTVELTRLHVTVPRRLLEKLAAARDALSHSHPRASDDEILELGLDLIVERHRKRRGIGAKPRRPAAAAAAAAAPSADVLATTTASGRVTPPSPVAAAAPVSVPVSAPVPAPVPAPVSAPVSAPVPARIAPRAAAPLRVPASPRVRTPALPRPHVPAVVWRAVWERDQGRCVWPVDGGGVCGSTRRLQLDHVDGWALGADTTVDACRLLCATHNDLHARALYGDDLMNRYSRPKGPRCSEAVASWAPAALWTSGAVAG
jgi:hypothetical protein